MKQKVILVIFNIILCISLLGIPGTAKANAQKSEPKTPESKYALQHDLESLPPDGNPSNLIAMADAIGPQISISWMDGSTNEAGFEIESSTTSGGPYILIANVPTDTVQYIDGGLSGNTTYYYRVRAFNKDGVSEYTNEAFAMATNADYAIDLGGDSYITFGNPDKLKLRKFTLECWFRRDGTGTGVSTGSGGMQNVVPLITKGVNEGDAPSKDVNYFIGISINPGPTYEVLAADFEEGPGTEHPSINHPIYGTTPIADDGTWHHAAVTYDGESWQLYLDGKPDGSLWVGQPPGYVSNQHVGIGSALNSTGTASGYFDGVIDEVRIWNYARSEEEINAAINEQLASPQGLIARWGLDEGAGTATYDSEPLKVTGSVMGFNWSWATSAPFNMDRAPFQPTLVYPANGGDAIPIPAELVVTPADPEASVLTTTFYGRSWCPPDFTVVMLPDAQNYTAYVNGGTPAIFATQTQWIVENQSIKNIPYVNTLGDTTNDNTDAQWQVGRDVMYALETAPFDIPYGVTLGNHDIYGNTTVPYNTYFGIDHFLGRSYYGDHYGTNNDNYYNLFSASGMDFVVISINCGSTPSSEVLTWADDVLSNNSTRQGIVVCHDLLDTSNNFSTIGLLVYNALKDNPNLFLMISGHRDTDGMRSDSDAGHTIYTLRSDYQTLPNGGNGWLRLLRFSPNDNKIYVRSYSSYLYSYYRGLGSSFDLIYDMGGPCSSFQQIGTPQVGASGLVAIVEWPDLIELQKYEWYVTVSDGNRTTTSPSWTFIAGSPTPVKLVDFNAMSLPQGIQLSWRSGQEINLLGFNVYRADAVDGRQVVINPNLILAINPGELKGNIYQFLDQTVEKGRTYFYWIGWLDSIGTELIGPVSISVPEYHAWLPMGFR